MTVVDIVPLTDDVRLFRLSRADGQPVAAFEPGAHVDVLGPTGITRQYSLCGHPDGGEHLLIAVKREKDSRGGSAALHDRVAVGDRLEVGTPRTLFPLQPGPGPHVLVGAGIGVTPLLSMAHRLHDEGREFALHLFASSRERAPFADQLPEYAFAERVRLHLGIARPDQPDVLRAVFAGAAPGTHVYTCGPKGFMQRVVEIASAHLAEDHVHLEHFAPLEPAEQGGDAFEVELDTGEVFPVPPNRSIVDVLAEGGIEIDTSCREGICGTCVLTVVDGVPDHRDNCLTRKEKEAGNLIAACVSRSRTPRLVVEPW